MLAKIHYTNKLSKTTFRFFFLYLFLFYFVPFFSHIFFHDEYNLVFKQTNSLLPVFFLPVFIFLIIIFERITFSNKLFFFNSVGKILEKKILNFGLLFLFFILSLNFFINYNLTFRHSGGKTLSGEGIEIIFLLALKAYFKAYIFFVLLKIINNLEVKKNEYFICLIVSLSYILSIMGSLDVLYIIISFLIGIKQQQFLFVKNKNNVSIFQRIGKILLLVLLIFSVVFIGNANKTGSDEAFEKFSDTNQSTQVYINTIRRISTWYISLMILGEKDLFDNERSYESLDGIISNTSGRLKTIIDKNAYTEDKKKVWSVNRMNYLQIFDMDTRERTGASPGLVASFFYIPFFPFNFLFIVFYTIFILRYFNKGFQNNITYKFSPLLNIIILYFLIPMFESPVDLINFIGPTFIYTLFFFGLLDRITVLNNLKS
jgi:hypothetical protein